MRRVRMVFLALLAVAIAAAGVLSKGLSADPGPAAGTVVAVSGLVLLGAGALLLRILWVVSGRGR